jgi:DNA invertase Pin-like site-specific DNA recombinase
MKIGYARVSTDDQNPALQLAALKRARCKKIFKDEGISGATTKRPALLRCLKQLQPGDTLVVCKLDRLGRSLRDLITMLDDLRARGVKFQSLTEDAKRRGVKFGRRPKLTPQQIEHARRLIDQGESATLFSINRTTLYRSLVA